MQKWAFNILINASKKNARRRERLFKYFEDVHVENGIVRFSTTPSTCPHVYDIEAQALTYKESHTGRIIYEDLNADYENEWKDNDEDAEEYEAIDWYM
jgi:hypothetical protein